MSIAVNVNSVSATTGSNGSQSVDAQIQSIQRQIKQLQATTKSVSEQIATTSATDPNKEILEKQLEAMQRQIEMLQQRILQLQEQKAKQKNARNETGAAATAKNQPPVAGAVSGMAGGAIDVSV